MAKEQEKKVMISKWKMFRYFQIRNLRMECKMKEGFENVI